jgi:hypothetical protein
MSAWVLGGKGGCVETGAMGTKSRMTVLTSRARASKAGAPYLAKSVELDDSFRCMRFLLLRPNEWLISCKRSVKTYGPLSSLGGAHAGGAWRRPRLSAAFAG